MERVGCPIPWLLIRMGPTLNSENRSVFPSGTGSSPWFRSIRPALMSSWLAYAARAWMRAALPPHRKYLVSPNRAGRLALWG